MKNRRSTQMNRPSKWVKTARELASKLNQDAHRYTVSFCTTMCIVVTALMFAEPANVEDAPKEESAEIEPFVKTLTDTQGRKIHGAIIGRKGDQITFRREGGEKDVIINTSLLSEKDKAFIKNLPEGMYTGKPVLETMVAKAKPDTVEAVNGKLTVVTHDDPNEPTPEAAPNPTTEKKKKTRSSR